jgi:hypothetical protein
MTYKECWKKYFTDMFADEDEFWAELNAYNKSRVSKDNDR